MTEETVAERVSWRGLQASLPFERLPALHRAFLIWREVPGAAELNVRRAQQRLEAELNRMVQEGSAQKAGDDWLISAQALAGFLAGFQPGVQNPTPPTT